MIQNSVENAIENKDKKMLVSMFSKRAQSEAEAFDESIECFFELFNDSNLIWDKEGAIEAYEDIENGSKIKQITSCYDVKGVNNKYKVFFVECTRNDRDKDNVGVYTLRIIEEKDIDTQYIRNDLMEMPGLYYKP